MQKRKSVTRKHHSKQLIAEIKANLILGGSISEVSQYFNIPESTVRNYFRQLTPDEIAKLNAKKESQIGSLMTEYLQETLKSLVDLASQVRNPEYIHCQKAQDIAILFGVMSDKAFKLIEAAQRARILKNSPEELFRTSLYE